MPSRRCTLKSGENKLHGSAASGRFLVAAAAWVATACWAPPRNIVRTSASDAGVVIEGLSACGPEPRGEILLDPTRPVTVLVHGCNFSQGAFRTLARVFEAHGQQAVCFDYNDRDRLETSSAQLVGALERLQTRLMPGEITLVGHSQGGLVARRALVGERVRPLRIDQGFRFRLVTVSAPFAGIHAARHCGLGWLHVLSLGATVGVCAAIAGDKWSEIYPGSPFMLRPGTLQSAVMGHVRIVTDERGACRRRDRAGHCAESDYVFGLPEQESGVVDGDPRVSGVQIHAGHVEIVGERGTPPTKLIDVLRAQEVLASTPPERSVEIAELLQALY